MRRFDILTLNNKEELMMSNKITYLTDETFEKEAAQSDQLVVIDFYADWCGPCQMVGPVMESLADKFDGKAKICKVNVDEQKKLAISHRVMSIPTVIFMKNGEVVDRVVGALPENAFEEKISSLL
ncbi:MAG: thioredoxin [Peptostreptococcales bacterium]